MYAATNYTAWTTTTHNITAFQLSQLRRGCISITTIQAPVVCQTPNILFEQCLDHADPISACTAECTKPAASRMISSRRAAHIASSSFISKGDQIIGDVCSWARWSTVTRRSSLKLQYWLGILGSHLPAHPHAQTVREVATSKWMKVEVVHLRSGRKYFWQCHVTEYWGPTAGTTGPVYQFAAHQLCWLSNAPTSRALLAVYLIYWSCYFLTTTVHYFLRIQHCRSNSVTKKQSQTVY